jgi:hypothetical protein
VKKKHLQLEALDKYLTDLKKIVGSTTPEEIRQELDAMTPEQRNETVAALREYKDQCEILVERLGGSIPTKWKD